MTLMNATSLDNQVDYSSTNSLGFADQTLNSIFNVSPQNAVRDEDDDDDDDLDATIPDPDEDDLIDDEDDAFPDDIDTLDDDEVVDEDDLDDEDLDNEETGSTTSGMNNPSTFGSGADGRTTGRMTDHEPGSGQ